ncbi:MAG: hypothetical protein ACJ74Y_16790, partial [Bryobacteraceae bacterium]
QLWSSYPVPHRTGGRSMTTAFIINHLPIITLIVLCGCVKLRVNISGSRWAPQWNVQLAARFGVSERFETHIL